MTDAGSKVGIAFSNLSRLSRSSNIAKIAKLSTQREFYTRTLTTN